MNALFHNKRIGVVAVTLIVAMLSGAAYWYWWRPRVKIGYGDLKISESQWSSIYPDAPYYRYSIESISRHRLDSPLLYEAFLLDYYSYGLLLTMDIPLPHELILKNSSERIYEEGKENPSESLGERLHRGEVRKEDAFQISKLLNECRSAWIESMKRNEMLNEERQTVAIRCVVAIYFYRYYDFYRYGKELDREESKEVAAWLNKQEKKGEVKKCLRDPLGWDNEELKKIKEIDEYSLEMFVASNPCAELLRDIPLYERVSHQYRSFLKQQGLKEDLIEEH